MIDTITNILEFELGYFKGQPVRVWHFCGIVLIVFFGYFWKSNHKKKQ